jgi:shikimate kinase
VKTAKFVILGPSSSGKTTIGNILKEKYALPIFECDDETRRLNKGRWPSSEKVVDRLFDKVNKIALEKKNIIYITSYLDQEEIQQFAARGFKFIFLYADFDVLLKRRLKREKLSPNLLARFKLRYEGILKLAYSPRLTEYFPIKFEVSSSTNEQISENIFHYISRVK